MKAVVGEDQSDVDSSDSDVEVARHCAVRTLPHTSVFAARDMGKYNKATKTFRPVAECEAAVDPVPQQNALKVLENEGEVDDDAAEVEGAMSTWCRRVAARRISKKKGSTS